MMVTFSGYSQLHSVWNWIWHIWGNPIGLDPFRLDSISEKGVIPVIPWKKNESYGHFHRDKRCGWSSEPKLEPKTQEFLATLATLVPTQPRNFLHVLTKKLPKAFETDGKKSYVTCRVSIQVDLPFFFRNWMELDRTSTGRDLHILEVKTIVSSEAAMPCLPGYGGETHGDVTWRHCCNVGLWMSQTGGWGVMGWSCENLVKS